VLLLTDPVDSFWTAMAPGFEGKPLKSLTHGDVDLSLVAKLDETSAAPSAGTAEGTADTIAAIKVALGDAVADVRASQRLVDSASCLVAPGAGPDRGLAKIMQRQQSGSASKPVLEVNPSHLLVQAVGRTSSEGRKEEAADLAWLLLDQAMVLEGELPHDPAKFADRLNRLVLKGLAPA
jgi:molecular chaperone HtpG